MLCIDQGEEVFSLCEDPDERREFLDTLVTQAQARSVLVAIRADRLADVAGHAGFSRLVERASTCVGASTSVACARRSRDRPGRRA